MFERLKIFYDNHYDGISTLLAFVIFFTYFPSIAYVIEPPENNIVATVIFLYVAIITIMFIFIIIKQADEFLEEHYVKKRKMREHAPKSED